MIPKFLIILILMTGLPIREAISQENTEWIVIGDDAATAFAASLTGELKSSFNVVETFNGRTVALINSSVEGFLQEVIHTKFHRCGGYTVHPTREAALAEAKNPLLRPRVRG